MSARDVRYIYFKTCIQLESMRNMLIYFVSISIRFSYINVSILQCSKLYQSEDKIPASYTEMSLCKVYFAQYMYRGTDISLLCRYINDFLRVFIILRSIKKAGLKR